jgi:hypothetical protein
MAAIFSSVPEEDHNKFVKLVLEEFQNLHEGNVIRFDVRPRSLLRGRRRSSSRSEAAIARIAIYLILCNWFPCTTQELRGGRGWGISLVPMRRNPMKSKPLSLIKNHSLTAAQSQEGYHATHGNQGRKQWTGSV